MLFKTCFFSFHYLREAQVDTSSCEQWPIILFSFITFNETSGRLSEALEFDVLPLFMNWEKQNEKQTLAAAVAVSATFYT